MRPKHILWIISILTIVLIGLIGCSGENDVDRITASVTINLVPSDGGSVVGATVRLSNFTDSTAYTQTAQGSSVSFSDVMIGRYTLTITLSGYSTYSQTVYIEPKGLIFTADLTAYSGGTTLSGTFYRNSNGTGWMWEFSSTGWFFAGDYDPWDTQSDPLRGWGSYQYNGTNLDLGSISGTAILSGTAPNRTLTLSGFSNLILYSQIILDYSIGHNINGTYYESSGGGGSDVTSFNIYNGTGKQLHYGYMGEVNAPTLDINLNNNISPSGSVTYYASPPLSTSNQYRIRYFNAPEGLLTRYWYQKDTYLTQGTTVSFYSSDNIRTDFSAAFDYFRWVGSIWSDGEPMTKAMRFTTFNIANFELAGKVLEGVVIPRGNVTTGSTLGWFTIRVWKGGYGAFDPEWYGEPGSLVVSQYVGELEQGYWNTIWLETPVTISANQELWIGFTVESYTGDYYPVPYDDGPAAYGLGHLFHDYEVSSNLQYGWRDYSDAFPSNSLANSNILILGIAFSPGRSGEPTVFGRNGIEEKIPVTSNPQPVNMRGTQR